MTIDIAYTINNDYVKYFLVSLLSLLDSNKEEDIWIHILSNDLEEKSKRLISAVIDEYDKHICFYDICGLDVFTDSVHSGYGIEVFLRLFLPWTLTNINQVLYLDADTLVRGNVAKYALLDMREMALAGCRDSEDMEKSVKERNALFKREHGDYSYYNAGVMIWNLQYIRDNYTMADFFDTVKCFGNKLLFNDQDILNYIFYEHIIDIDDKSFNYLTEIFCNDECFIRDVEAAAIIHFAGANPWKVGKRNRLDYELWWSKAEQTKLYREIVDSTLQNLTDVMDFERSNSRVYKAYSLFKLSRTNVIDKPLLKNCERISLYGAGAWCRLFLDELGENTYLVKHIVGKNVGDIINGFKVESFESIIDEINTDDLLIITPLQSFDEIFDLIKDVIKIKIINLADIW